MDANRFSRIIGQPLLPSTPIERWPHTGLLQEHRRIGDRILDPELFFKTDYAKLGMLCIDVTGQYFNAKTPDALIGVAKDFLVRSYGNASPLQSPNNLGEGHSRPGEPVLVRPISLSDCFQVVDGHHRLAIEWSQGNHKALVASCGKPVMTPLQEMIRDSTWSRGSLELYQPVESPELEKEWILVRRCKDRLNKMLQFLDSHGFSQGDAHTYLDVASNYGWFVAKMSEHGYRSHGVERDPMACRLASLLNGLKPEQVFQSEAVRFLSSTPQKYDIVSCLSLLHHFALGLNAIDASELLRLLDSATQHVLFIDMGQSHEAWFKNTLPEWDADFIEKWIRETSTFKHIVRLGPDHDNVFPFADNYGRELFACFR